MESSDFAYLQMLMRGRKLQANGAGLPTVKIAVLGDSSTQQLVPILKACLHAHGLYADIYEAAYDVIDQEILNEGSGLYAFAPEYVVLQVSMQRLRERHHQEGRDGAALAARTLERARQWWDVLGRRLSCRVIHFLYERPQERPFGHYTARVDGSLLAAVDALNASLPQAAKSCSNVFFVDVDHLAALAGKARWNDEKLWVHGKMFCSPACLPSLGQAVAAIVAAGAGKAKKCLVLDLDNTLWGGEVAEDGVDGLELGDHGVGEAFVLFQRFLLTLKERGMILAVCSKNDHETALSVFRRHPDMVLRENDVSLFAVNWNNKGDNIRGIAQSLNIGLDSIVFLDDSTFERNQVRSMLPEVFVPEMPEDPAEFVPFLNGLELFEALSFSEEDRGRADFYRQEAGRGQEKAKFSDVSGYLQSLEMKVALRRFDAFPLARIVQLLQRSNQFNLTTRRHNEKDCEAFLRRPDAWIPLAASLRDKFGDSGLISVIVLKVEGEKMTVDTWLMSCRVLLRGVEQFCMNAVVALARERGCREIEGQYIPTAKNGMVREFFAQFGFKKIAEDEAGASRWALRVADYRDAPVFIESSSEAEWQAQKS